MHTSIPRAAADSAVRALKDIVGYFKWGFPGLKQTEMLRETELALEDIARYRANAVYLDTWDLEEPEMVNLFIVTGCPYWQQCQIVTPEMVAPPGHAVLQRCMYRLLEAALPAIGEFHVPILIGGVARHELGAGMAADEKGAYALAAGLLKYTAYLDRDPYSYLKGSGYYKNLPGHVLSATGDDVLRMFNAWVKPETPWPDLKDAKGVARALFGNAWVSMFELTAAAGASIGDAVYRERPPFLPGLCPAQVQQPQVDLPPGLAW